MTPGPPAPASAGAVCAIGLAVPTSPVRRNIQSLAPTMCRNIRTLFNFEPPATELEIRDASLQFVRKLSGFAVPSRANEAVFNQAVDDVARVARTLIAGLVTHAEPRNRDMEAAKARARSAARFGSPGDPAA